MFEKVMYIAQAASALWVANIAGALAGLYGGCDALDNGTPAGCLPFGANAANGMVETITHHYRLVVRPFLVNKLSQLILGKGLPAILSIIDDGAIR